MSDVSLFVLITVCALCVMFSKCSCVLFSLYALCVIFSKCCADDILLLLTFVCSLVSSVQDIRQEELEELKV